MFIVTEYAALNEWYEFCKELKYLKTIPDPICLTLDREAAGSSLNGITALWPWARHTNPSLVLVQPRKTRPYITERLLMGRKESNQTEPISIHFWGTNMRPPHIFAELISTCKDHMRINCVYGSLFDFVAG